MSRQRRHAYVDTASNEDANGSLPGWCDSIIVTLCLLLLSIYHLVIFLLDNICQQCAWGCFLDTVPDTIQDTVQHIVLDIVIDKDA